MPGKQMSIDADLNAGLIDEQEARRRREILSREADFYGAMDGASKFVRGDAIAGILIIVINIIGGLAIGRPPARTWPWPRGPDLHPADRRRRPGDPDPRPDHLDRGRHHRHPRRLRVQPGQARSPASSSSSRAPWAWSSGVLFGFALIPGLPTAALSGAGGPGRDAGLLAWCRRSGRWPRPRTPRSRSRRRPPRETLTAELCRPSTSSGLEVGYGLIPLVDAEQNGELLERIQRHPPPDRLRTWGSSCRRCTSGTTCS